MKITTERNENKLTLFTHTYLRYRQKMIAYIKNISGREAAYAEDIFQQIFLKLWENDTSLNQIKSIENYLFASVRNSLSNERKRMQVWEKYSIWAEQMQDCIPIDEQHEVRQAQLLFTQAIGQLSPRAQQAFMLRCEGLSYIEIAKQMQVSKSVVKQHLARAKKQLRSIISSRLN